MLVDGEILQRSSVSFPFRHSSRPAEIFADRLLLHSDSRGGVCFARQCCSCCGFSAPFQGFHPFQVLCLENPPRLDPLFRWFGHLSDGSFRSRTALDPEVSGPCLHRVDQFRPKEQVVFEWFLVAASEFLRRERVFFIRLFMSLKPRLL